MDAGAGPEPPLPAKPGRAFRRGAEGDDSPARLPSPSHQPGGTFQRRAEGGAPARPSIRAVSAPRPDAPPGQLRHQPVSKLDFTASA